jgi:predicted hotdog family 3-hydroxylacyl-ACP dehydratase
MSQDLSNPEKYLIQRDRMKLIDAIVDVDTKKAVARSVVSGLWPLQTSRGVSPLVIIELVAQTAGIQIRWDELEKNFKSPMGGGFIVGVRDAEFFCDTIALGSAVETCAEKIASYMNYAEFQGKTFVDGQVLGQAVIQVLRTD